MKSVFHAGEREVQQRANVAQMANRLGNAIHSTLPPIAQEFLQHQPMAIAATVDPQGAVWASLLTGEPGFMQAVDAHTVFLDAEPLSGDPLRHILDTQDSMERPDVGLLAIELATRKRIRVNGKAERRPEGGFFLHVQQAYANCPKYIQARSLVKETEIVSKPSTTRRGEQLTAEQQEWITRSDTFFIASSHPEGGADASHRGGQPGFVHALNEKTLAFPDYAGNNMFNTLGNLTANPRAGLLFLNFETGDILQLTGETQILWDTGHTLGFPGAERVIEFNILAVLQTENAVAMRWRFEDYSPFNPR